VSSWNFDVAQLKAQADLEGEDELLLPSISEHEEREETAVTAGVAASSQALEAPQQDSKAGPSHISQLGGS
jgi:hypothetical protein